MDCNDGNGRKTLPHMLAELAALLARANENLHPRAEPQQHAHAHDSGFVRVSSSSDTQTATPMAVTRHVPVVVDTPPPQPQQQPQHIEQAKMLEQYYRQQRRERIARRAAAQQSSTPAPTVKEEENEAHVSDKKQQQQEELSTKKRQRIPSSAPVPAITPVKQRKAATKSGGTRATSVQRRDAGGGDNAVKTTTTKTTKPPTLHEKSPTTKVSVTSKAPVPTSASMAAGGDGMQSKVRSLSSLRRSLAHLLGGMEHIPELTWDRKRAFIVPMQTRECLLWTLCEKRLLATGEASIDEATRRTAIDKSIEEEAQLFAKSSSKSSYKSLSLALIRNASSTAPAAMHASSSSDKQAKHEETKKLSENQAVARAVREKLLGRIPSTTTTTKS